MGRFPESIKKMGKGVKKQAGDDGIWAVMTETWRKNGLEGKLAEKDGGHADGRMWK